MLNLFSSVVSVCWCVTYNEFDDLFVCFIFDFAGLPELEVVVEREYLADLGVHQ